MILSRSFMYVSSFIFATLCVTAVYSQQADQKDIPKGMPPIHFYCSPQVYSQGGNALSQASTSTQVNLSVTIRELSAPLANMVQTWSQEQLARGSSYIAYMKQHKLKTLLGACAFGYCSTTALFMWYVYRIRTLTWSQWHADTPLELLLSTPHERLIKTLLTDIQQKYQTAQEPTNFLTPLKKFSFAIDSEIEILKTFLSINRMVCRLPLVKHIGYTGDSLQVVQEQLKRAICLRELFKRWCAEYTLQINHT